MGSVKEKNVHGVVLARKTVFTGSRKVGLDSDIVINLITKDIPKYMGSRIFKKRGIFYIHEVSLFEVVKILMTKKGYSKDRAVRKFHDFIRENNISMIKRDIQNKQILIDLRKKCKSKGILIHRPDDYIISDFKKAGINLVYSHTGHFKQACELIGMQVGAFPVLDKRTKKRLIDIWKSKGV